MDQYSYPFCLGNCFRSTCTMKEKKVSISKMKSIIGWWWCQCGCLSHEAHLSPEIKREGISSSHWWWQFLLCIIHHFTLTTQHKHTCSLEMPTKCSHYFFSALFGWYFCIFGSPPFPPLFLTENMWCYEILCFILFVWFFFGIIFAVKQRKGMESISVLHDWFS